MTSHEHLKNLIRELDIDPSPIIELVGKERVMQAIGENLLKDIGILYTKMKFAVIVK